MPCEKHHNRRAEPDRSDAEQNMIPAAIIQSADCPEQILLHLLLIHYGKDCCSARRKEHPHDNTREEERHDGNAAVPHRQGHGETHREHRPCKRKGRKREYTSRRYPHANGEHGADRGAARYANDAGVRERVAEYPLKDSAGDAKPRTDHQPDKRTREADVPEHGLLLRRNDDIGEDRQSCRMGKGSYDGLHRDVILPRTHRENNGKEKCSAERTQKKSCAPYVLHVSVPLSPDAPRITSSR